MNKYTKLIILILLILVTGCSNDIKATYIGVTNDNLTKEDILKNNNKVFKFLINDEEVILGIDNDKEYSILNNLIENEEYFIQMDNNNIITSLKIKKNDKIYTSIVNGIEGEKSIKNLLKIAFEPLGTTLYIYGGGWNVQDDGASNLSRTIGVSQIWVDFFNKMDENYNFLDYYPDYEWNKYHYLGLDCSGYIGWIVYNIMNTESMNKGYVTSSTKMANSLANNYNLGIFEKISNSNMTKEEYYLKVIDTLNPGDIISIKGHTYMIVGVCDDNSVIIINSTATDSINGITGGGVQLSVISKDNNSDNEAYKLASYYMEKYYNNWYQRYPIVIKNIDTYFNFNNDYTGIFHWNILKDDENYLNMDADTILKNIFED